MNEADTRAELIDPKLNASGWGVIEGSRILRERDVCKITDGRIQVGGGRKKALIADYILTYKGIKLAIVEAKSSDFEVGEGVAQAKQYAEKLNLETTYSTNGKEIYPICMKTGEEGLVQDFLSPQQLWDKTYTDQNDWRDKFASIPFEDKSGTWQLRYYQEIAIKNTLEAVAQNQDRILLTLATGTGKTAIAFQIAWKLFKTRWNLNRDGKRRPRILFLADRNILADQAYNSFSAFPEDAMVRIKPKEIRKKGKVPTNGSIFFTIFQSFMSGTDDEGNPEPSFGQYPSDYFDFIIIDECHRGGANDEGNWRGILEYFSPAVQLGLTATPKRQDNVDTYAYFVEPVYIYSLKEGINDGFLSPFKVKEISTTIDEYMYTPGDDIEGGEIDIEREYTEEDFNKIIEIKAREEYRVKLFLDSINQNQKTLVFCATQIHAAAIRDLINQYATNKNPNYCHRVTADDGKIGEQHLRDFQDNEKSIPTILTTSQKLSTGVDAPEIRNIVLLRPVNSMVEFKQIVGRGTRLFDGKDYFTIYDFVDAHHHFQAPEWDGEPLEPEPVEPRPETQPCKVCGQRPCQCTNEPPAPCYECGNDPCVCDNPPRKIIKVKLSDQKVRELDSMVKTSFWSPDGRPISAEEFVRNLFGDIPSFFKDEDHLRRIWSLPSTRKKLLEELSEKGYTSAQLDDLSKLIHGEDCDLYDILAYVAYHKDLVPRLDRADKARIQLSDYNPKQQGFLNFVLKQYVEVGVNELDDAKLPDLLELKYHAISDAKKELGDIASIRNACIGFQEYLYGGEAS